MIFSFATDCRLVVKAEGEGELQGGQSSIINGSFEDPDKKSEDTKNIGYLYTDQGEILGWNTTSTDGKIELGWLKGNGTSPHMIPTVVTEIISGIGASDGWQFAETIGNEVSTIYQSLSLEAGMSYNWTVHHRGRKGVDTLALFFVEDTGVNYVKSAKGNLDHFDQIIDWMKNTKGIPSPAAGEMEPYTVYTTALGDNGAFTEADDGYFSFNSDAEHTVKFEVHLMSTARTDWGKYTGTYVSESDGNVLFALTCFKSASSSATSGNLVDNLSFSSVYDNINLLANPGFDDAEVPVESALKGYYSAKAANASSPFSNIGWCSTASDYVVELGTLKGGEDAYGLEVGLKKVTYNAPSIRDGQQFAELNADQESSLYQIVTTEPGKMYKWSLSHRGRDGLDTMALVIGPKQPFAPKKTSETARDQLMQIVDWLLYSQKDVVLDIPDKGCSNEIKLYTPKFNGNGGFEGDSTFTWYADETHTEEWSVWIISSDNSGWHDYGEIQTGAKTYNYDYIVPQGQKNSIFGFVSVKPAPRANDGKLDKTYGNFLDNIAFKEYYYVDAKFKGSSEIGYVYVKPENSENYISTDGSQGNTGWSLAGSEITVSFQQEKREFLGAYINGVFYSKDNALWNVTTNAQGKTIYSFTQTTNKAITVRIVYQAKNVIYDTRNNYTYQYDLNIPDSGREVPMGSNQEKPLLEYTSHAPKADDGWKFLGWRYIEIKGENQTSHLVDAVHKVKCDSGDTTLSIWEKGENDNYQVLVDGIPFDEGITFFGEWKYRQRVISQTFNLSGYDISRKGGDVEVKIAFTEDKNPSTPTDYKVGEDVVGKDIFAAADGTIINITAKNKANYVFNGWYDESGKLVSRNPSYTYKVVDGGVLTYYARFELFGNDLTINTTVKGEADKYFAVDCSFSNLRGNHLYAISGLVNDEVVTNPTILRADELGNAQITIYVKHRDRAVFKYLPEKCHYSVNVKESSKDGYSVKGEVSNQTFGKVDKTIELALNQSKQESWIAPGKHYQDIFAHVQGDIVTITPKSSFTLYVETAYAPSFYTNLSASLCFFNAEGVAQNFAKGTRILMVDKCNAAKPKFYCFTVNNDSTSEIALTDFIALGSQNVKFALPSGENITEKLLFAVDYVGTNNAPSGKLSLVYSYGNNSAEAVKPATPKAVATGNDATSFTMTAQNAKAASVGPFEVKLKISASSPAINTTYVGYNDSKYSVKLSLNGDPLPAGSYAEVNGKIYHSCNGYIIVSPLSTGEITVQLYSPKPLVASNGERVTIKAELLSAVSTANSIPAGKSDTVEFTCVKYAMDADILNKVLTPGQISQVAVNLNYEGIDAVKLTVSKKNDNGTYSKLIENVAVNLPTVTVNLGSSFTAEAGETYIFSFVGYAEGVPVSRDDCCIVGGYE